MCGTIRKGFVSSESAAFISLSIDTPAPTPIWLTESLSLDCLASIGCGIVITLRILELNYLVAREVDRPCFEIAGDSLSVC